MEIDTILNVVGDALLTVMLVSAPPLLVGLTVGLVVSIFQAVTSIQEQTLAFVPKIIAVLGAILFFGNFMFTTMQDFASNLIQMIPELIRDR